MKFKDIVNRDLVKLTNCEHEAIHIPGSIQPHGFLIGLKPGDLTIDYCSGNCNEFITLSYEELLGKSFNLLFGDIETNNLIQYISSNNGNSTSPLLIKLNDKKFSCTIQKSAAIFLLEFEPVSEISIAIADIYLQTKKFTLYMQSASTLQMLCQAVAEETRAITGYDRVMIYRFDEDYNGEVFAESKIDSVEPFLGLHYPQTDIPVQARELYIKNLLRLIVDVNYTPVPLYTLDDGSAKNLDLSFSTLRSVSPIHIQYLQNMGVAATMSISLMHENRLWGLIACHHYSAKYITNNTRIAAQLQGHFLTSQISVRQLAEEYEVAKKVNKALADLLARVFSSDSIKLSQLINEPELLTLTNAAGVIIIVDEKIYSQGNVPPQETIRELANWLFTNNLQTGLNTANLSILYTCADKWCNSTAGIIYHSLASRPNNCIIWCRPEALQEVNWGGNPQNAIIKDEKGLSPRKSFELWKEIKKCESNSWLKPELDAAVNFANALQKHVHMIFLTNEELIQRTLSEKLKLANAELENLNWIASHDLKEPLRKIQVFASIILGDEGVSDSITKSVIKMSESAKRMQTLIGDILAYSRLGHVEDGFEMVNMNELIEQVLNEISFESGEKNAVIEYNNLPSLNVIPFLINQLFINLLRNSLKFSKADIIPHISITSEEVSFSPDELISSEKFQKISIIDNGIGFDEQYHDSIFKVFTKLHNQKEYTGSGVGLALCRKIMKSHHGYIIGEGVPGTGATFSLYFPV